MLDIENNLTKLNSILLLYSPRQGILPQSAKDGLGVTLISGMLEHVAGVGPSGVGRDAGQDNYRLLDEGDVENAAFDVDAVQDL